MDLTLADFSRLVNHPDKAVRARYIAQNRLAAAGGLVWTPDAIAQARVHLAEVEALPKPEPGWTCCVCGGPVQQQANRISLDIHYCRAKACARVRERRWREQRVSAPPQKGDSA